jgi:hypothetical protein
MTMRIGAALLVALLALPACDDDGASVRDLGGSASSGSGSGSGTGHASGSGTGAASGSELACVEPDETPFGVRLDEFSVTPEDDESSGFPVILAENVGRLAHELVVVEAPSIESLPLDRDGAVDEEKLDPEQVVLHAGAIEGGESCALEVDLEPSTYVLFCNIVDRGEDKVRSHFLRGMRARIKVS